MEKTRVSNRRSLSVWGEKGHNEGEEEKGTPPEKVTILWGKKQKNNRSFRGQLAKRDRVPQDYNLMQDWSMGGRGGGKKRDLQKKLIKEGLAGKVRKRPKRPPGYQVKRVLRRGPNSGTSSEMVLSWRHHVDRRSKDTLPLIFFRKNKGIYEKNLKKETPISDIIRVDGEQGNRGLVLQSAFARGTGGRGSVSLRGKTLAGKKNLPQGEDERLSKTGTSFAGGKGLQMLLATVSSP